MRTQATAAVMVVAAPLLVLGSLQAVEAEIAAIGKLLPGADDRGRAILTEYRGYLMRYPMSEAAE